MAAVVERAVRYYLVALRRVRRGTAGGHEWNVINECEGFFREQMDFYSEIDGEQLIRTLRQESETERFDKRVMVTTGKRTI